ncbi:GntR family transcriptional regulator, partial [Clavibacter michiganensis]|uniref:GntR family transcriptional regulator n=1 Tax=Clavibacter michiganensis TaxID=28447 RepID=UPI00292D4A41
DKIRDAIMDGTPEPGERLNDDDLIAWLGVSRTPIREALAELARAGLIEMAPNRYTRVAAPTKDELLDAYRTLGVIYGGVVRLAVPRFSDAERERVLGVLDDVLARLDADQQADLAREGANVY